MSRSCSLRNQPGPFMSYVHRLDETNVGDLFCAPYRYLDVAPGAVHDICDASLDVSGDRVVIVGGGGLGRKFFSKPLARLARPDRPYRLIAWGVGADTVIDKSGAALPPGDYDLFSPYFAGFDEVGHRSWNPADQRHRWVPCASAMHEALERFRERRPTKLVGFYQHKHSRFSGQDGATMTNNGRDLEAKLAFLADHEYVVSNTYHGVYWATLLGRKVLCLPFKSGLFSFRHRPVYIDTLEPTEDRLHAARAYPESLEECRAANLAFRDHLVATYDLG